MPWLGPVTPLAQPSPPALKIFVEEVVGRWLLLTYPDGSRGRLRLRPDRHFDLLRPSGREIEGKWKVKHGAVCLKQKAPFTFDHSRCFGIQPLAHGYWRGFGGEAATFALQLERSSR